MADQKSLKCGVAAQEMWWWTVGLVVYSFGCVSVDCVLCVPCLGVVQYMCVRVMYRLYGSALCSVSDCVLVE